MSRSRESIRISGVSGDGRGPWGFFRDGELRPSFHAARLPPLSPPSLDTPEILMLSVMATRLVLLRSRLLFPATVGAAEEAERDAGREIARLNELRVIRAAAAWLQARPRFCR